MTRSSKLNDPYIIIRLQGGLGNQLFMYAFAKSISMKNRLQIKLDTTSGFYNDKVYKRKYLLHHFSIDDEVTSEWESFYHLWGERRRSLVRRYNKLLPLIKRNYIKEKVKGFDRDIFEMPIRRTTYYDGYWQSYKYFEWIEGFLREKLSFDFPLTPEILEEAKSIEKCNAVCLGIRRFDDIPIKRRSRKNILRADYYEKAMHLIENKVLEPHLFVFTQDIEWAKYYLSSNQYHVTFINEKDSHLGAVVDLWLMTLCKHYVISNSTLHWWGAWLNKDPHKVVIAPQNGWGNRDILPPTWISIPD